MQDFVPTCRTPSFNDEIQRKCYARFVAPAQPPPVAHKLSKVMLIYAVLAPCTTVMIRDFLSIKAKLISYYDDISINKPPDQWGEMGN